MSALRVTRGASYRISLLVLSLGPVIACATAEVAREPAVSAAIDVASRDESQPFTEVWPSLRERYLALPPAAQRDAAILGFAKRGWETDVVLDIDEFMFEIAGAPEESDRDWVARGYAFACRLRGELDQSIPVLRARAEASTGPIEEAYATLEAEARARRERAEVLIPRYLRRSSAIGGGQPEPGRRVAACVEEGGAARRG